MSEDIDSQLSAEPNVTKDGQALVILGMKSQNMEARIGLKAEGLTYEALSGIVKMLSETRDRAIQLAAWNARDDAQPVLYMSGTVSLLRCLHAEDTEDGVKQCEWEANHPNALHSFEPGVGSEINDRPRKWSRQ